MDLSTPPNALTKLVRGQIQTQIRADASPKQVKTGKQKNAQQKQGGKKARAKAQGAES